MSMRRAVAFLDRDGTINVDHGYVHRIQDWEFVGGAIDAICALRQVGFAIAVVSNQAGIAAGRYSVADVDQLHRQVNQLLADADTGIDAWAFCPHAAVEQCGCRKPRTGLAENIERQLGQPIDYARSWTIGDKPSDVEFGQNLGTHTALLTSRYWTSDDLACQPDVVASSLAEAVQFLLGRFPPEQT